MPIQVNDGLQVNAPRYADMRAGKLVAGRNVPYDSIAEALAAIPLAYRCEGLEFKVKDGREIKTYEFVANLSDDQVREVSGMVNQQWMAVITPTVNAFWYAVTYGNGLFVAVSNNGGNHLAGVMTSQDGLDWSSQVAGLNTSWSSVTYGNGLYVAVAYGGIERIMTSTDAVTWSYNTIGDDSNWTSVTYGNGLFVAVANAGLNSVMTSPDGINWTMQTAPFQSWSSVTYGNGLFVAVASENIMTSADGINWTTQTAPAGNWSSVTYGNGLYVAVATDGKTMVSSNGTLWFANQDLPQIDWVSVTYGNGLFVAVSSLGYNDAMVSTDGFNWTLGNSGFNNQMSSVTYGNGTFVAVCSNPISSNQQAIVLNPFTRSISFNTKVFQYTPSSSADTIGEPNDLRYDEDFLYIKTPFEWKRVALNSF